MYTGYNPNQNKGYTSGGGQQGYSSANQPNQPGLVQYPNQFIQQPTFMQPINPGFQPIYPQPTFMHQPTYQQPMQPMQPQYQQPMQPMQPQYQQYQQPMQPQPTYQQPMQPQPTYQQPMQPQPTYQPQPQQPVQPQPTYQPQPQQPVQPQPAYQPQPQQPVQPQPAYKPQPQQPVQPQPTYQPQPPQQPPTRPNQYKKIPIPPGWNPEDDCEKLRTAMRGLGTDEDAIINIVCNRTNEQRMTIKKYYSTMYGKDLVKELKSELSGKFEDFILGLFMTFSEYDAQCLYIAMKGAGTNEETLTEIIGTRTNQQLAQIKIDFERMYKKPLLKWVESETSGHYRKLLVSLLQCNRSENYYPNEEACRNDAQKLINAGIARLGTDESMFNRIFALRSPEELKMICKCYQQLSGKTLIDSVNKEFSGDNKSLLKTVIYGIENPSEYFAKEIYESMKGLGTKDKKLMRILISRDEIDLKEIKANYYRLYGKDMLSDIRGDTSGDYRKALVQLAGHNY